MYDVDMSHMTDLIRKNGNHATSSRHEVFSRTHADVMHIHHFLYKAYGTPRKKRYCTIEMILA